MKSVVFLFLVLVSCQISACPKYNRTDYHHWIDEDRYRQNTLNEVLIQESRDPVFFKSYKKHLLFSLSWLVFDWISQSSNSADFNFNNVSWFHENLRIKFESYPPRFPDTNDITSFQSVESGGVIDPLKGCNPEYSPPVIPSISSGQNSDNLVWIFGPEKNELIQIP